MKKQEIKNIKEIDTEKVREIASMVLTVIGIVVVEIIKAMKK